MQKEWDAQLQRLNKDNQSVVLEKSNLLATVLNIELRSNPFLLSTALTIPSPSILFSFINPYESNIVSRRFSWFSVILYQKSVAQLLIGKYDSIRHSDSDTILL